MAIDTIVVNVEKVQENGEIYFLAMSKQVP